MSKCRHENFNANVAIGRLLASDPIPGLEELIVGFSAGININCADCGVSMEFIGLPMGLLPTEPTCSVDGIEARIPIKPVGENMSMNLPGFKVRRVV